ncbi:MAG: hypothetical protein IJW24_03225, partial [Clostridia bacterium]|nr:hypothetical protein [Clostridia bacterium]
MKNKEQKKRIKNKGKMSKLARAMIIIGLILAVAGIAVGIYFLLRTPDRDSDAPVLPPEQQEWVDAIIDSNNVPADLTEQSFVLPSAGAYGEEIELSDVVFVSNEYIVVETASGKVLFIRDESNDLTGGEPIIVDSFVSDDLDVCYDDVLSIYGKYALVSCSVHDKSFVVDIDSREVLCDVSDFTKVEFK